MKQVFLCLTIGWMCFVFYQGSRQIDESFSHSDVIVDQVIEIIETIQETFKKKPASTETNQVVTQKPENQVDEVALTKEKFRKDVAYIIRKSAHFFEYGLLAALLAITFYLLKQSKLNLVIYSLFITLLCAVGDEFYQSAHFFEYGLLAALLAITFYLLKQSKLNLVIYSLFITLLCAVGDEFYQSFIGRSSNVRDIIIDFSGALVGITCVGVVLGLIKSLKSKIMKAY